MIGSPGIAASAYGFTGEYSDPSGLQYLRARYYNPALGAFTQMDPALGVVGGQSIRWNPYVYAGANPVNFVDPNGEFFWFAAAALVGGTLIGGTTYAAWDVSVNQGIGLGGRNQGNFSAIDWGLAGDAFRTGANTGLFVSSFFAGGIAGNALSKTGATGWQAARYLAGYNALDIAWGTTVDYTLNGDSFGAAALWNVAGFGLGELAGFGAERGLRRRGRGINNVGHYVGDTRFGHATLNAFLSPAGLFTSIGGSGFYFQRRFPGDEWSLRLPENMGISSERRFWTRNVDFQGKTVYLRDDLIDPSRTNRSSISSLDLMMSGQAPIGPDGQPIQLHHLIQTSYSSVAEVTTSFHRQYKSILHMYPNTALPMDWNIDRATFDRWRRAYWRARAHDFINYE